MPDIVVSEFMQPSAVDELRRDLDLHYDETLYRRLDELYALGSGARAICVRNETEIHGAFFDAFPTLKAVGPLGVFATEPLPADNPFHGVPNLILTPHIGTTTEEARIGTGRMIADNVRAVLTGTIPDTAIV